MVIGFDLISDLNLTVDDNFSWDGKATSLYCLVAGNVSSNISVVASTLHHLSQFYQGVFYTPGSLEFSESDDYKEKIKQIIAICRKFKNVALLYHQVAIVDGIAILGCPGWYGGEQDPDYELVHNVNKYEDLAYLKSSIEKLQKHLDVKRIVLVTNAVPNKALYFKEHPKESEYLPDLSMILDYDSESKIKHWFYGSYEKIVDTKVFDINYVCNSSYKRNPYWAKRVDVEF